MRVLVLVLLLMIPIPARADDAHSRRAPTTAVALSAGTTLGGILVLSSAGLIDRNAQAAEYVGLAGALVTFYGPTVGHAYAGRPLTGWLGLRAIALAGAAGSAAVCLHWRGCPPGELSSDAVFVMFGASVLTYVVATVADVLTAPRDVRRYNAKHAVMIAPTVGGGGGGLALAGRF